MADPTKRRRPPPGSSLPTRSLVEQSNRGRAELVSAARAHLDASLGSLEDALGHMTASRIDHPIMGELREAILVGKRMIARSSEILKRIP